MGTKQILIPLFVVAASAFFMGVYGYGKEYMSSPYKDKNLVLQGMTMPTIWLYYDTSDVNSRWWADFGARSTRVLNMPFLNLCYESIVAKNSAHYKIEIIGGLSDLASRLGGWDALPRGLRNPLANVGTAELNWIRACVLAKWGGLWVHPASVSLQAFPEIPYEKVVFYGTDGDESYSGPNGTAVPSMYVMGAGRAGHPVFVQWADAAFQRLNAQGGGQQIRGDAKWDFVAYASTNPDTIVVPNGELSRKANGKRIQLEDLLAAGQEGDLRFTVTKEAVYVPIPWPELRERRIFGWFLRMSEDQILGSDLAISDLFRSS